MSDLPFYDPHRACPKCRLTTCGTRHMPRLDVMQRSCTRCGYEWSERPLGAEADVLGDWAEAARLASEAARGLGRIMPEDWSGLAEKIARRAANTKVVVDFSSIFGRSDRDDR